MESMVNLKFWEGKSVLITGHTGFKGYSLSPPTEPNNYELTGIKNDIHNYSADIIDFNSIRKAVEASQPEIVFHLAAQPLVRRSYIAPIETYSTNVMGTVNLFEAIRQVGCVRAVINVTSDKCYENKEWVWGYRENDPMGGYDPYSSSKGCAELITAAYLRSFFNPDEYEKHRTGLASVRAGNVIGGGDFAEDRLVPDLVSSFLKDQSVLIRSPNAVRPWQHVLEPLSGYLLLAERLYSKGKIYSGAWNFGPPEASFKEVGWIVKKIVSIWGQDAKWEIDKENHPHEAQLLRLDCSKAHTLLGWRPLLSLEKTLEWTVNWYKLFCSSPNLLREKAEEQIKNYENQSVTA